MNRLGNSSLQKHRQLKGKIAISCKAKIRSREDLATYYTPGIAAVASKIAKQKCKIWEYTSRSNLVAVVSDGSAVLGLGNIGAEAAQPVMAGKAILFKEFAGIDAFPICLDTQNAEEIIKICKALAPSFAGINLEDIAAPRCFEIEKKLQDIGIPVMHDDQHGTAVVVLAALINATKVIGKKLDECHLVISGLGAAGTAIATMVNKYTKGKIIIDPTDKEGAVCPNLEANSHKKAVCKSIKHSATKGSLEDVIKGADIFIGVSAPNVLSKKMVESMANNAIVFALANPIPEIDPLVAKKAGAKIVATGRSDLPNQVNNVLAFPGIFKGALEAKAIKITENMKIAASLALAKTIKPRADFILPDPLDKTVVDKIAREVKKAAIKEGVVRKICAP
jgi:malate dehydrogenase (oxaloacetate-decarboxylating)